MVAFTLEAEQVLGVANKQPVHCHGSATASEGFFGLIAKSIDELKIRKWRAYE